MKTRESPPPEPSPEPARDDRRAGSRPDEATLLAMLYWMRLARAVDDRCHTLFKQGKLPGVIFSQRGHEAIAVGAGLALGPDDVVAPLHRDLGTYLLRGMSPARVFAQALGRIAAPSRGRDLNTHGLGDSSLGIIGYVSHIPQSMPVALGAALAFQYRREPRVAMTFFGDGASSEGGFHETLNFAAVLKAPVVFALENNGYAYSTPTRHQYACERLVDRAAGYGMAGASVDGNDVEAVWRAAGDAVERARSGGGPTLIEARTFRVRGHAAHDRADYVPRELLRQWEARDPIPRFEERLRSRGLLDDARERELAERVAREVDDAVQEAERSPLPDPSTLSDGVWAE